MMKKRLAVVLIGIFGVGAATGVLGATTVREIKAQINSALKVKVNGKELIVKDSKGNIISNIQYNGMVYVPAKNLADNIKLAYNYDSKANTVFLGEKEGKGTSLIELKPDSLDRMFDYEIYKTKDSKILTYTPGNKVFSTGIYVLGIDKDSSYSATYRVDINGNYQKLTFGAFCEGEYGIIKVCDANTGVLLTKITLKGTGLVENNVIDVAGVTSLRFSVQTQMDSKVVIADPYLK